MLRFLEGLAEVVVHRLLGVLLGLLDLTVERNVRGEVQIARATRQGPGGQRPNQVIYFLAPYKYISTLTLTTRFPASA
jgi:hypothetical protein